MNRVLFITMAFVMLLSGCKNDEPEPWDKDTDNYEGTHTDFRLGPESHGLDNGSINISFLSEDGTVFQRRAIHNRIDNVSTFRLEVGLREGVYRLLAAEAVTDYLTEEDGGADKIEFGLGSRIRVDESGINVIDKFNPVLRYAGEGTKENPYIVSSSSHLFSLMMAVNDYDSNREITPGTYFRQVCDIDMKSMSRSCDAENGWLPIGFDTNTPFRGIYLGDNHVISNLIIKRPHSAGIGLFGYLHDGAVDGLKMRGASIEGQFAVGAIAGAVITSGNNNRGSGTITNCSTEECVVKGDATSAMVGGILGAVDMHAKALLADCSTNGGSVDGGMNVGGLFGGAGIYSSVMMSSCSNTSKVSASASGVGGLVGTADTLQIVGSKNLARVEGPKSSGKDTPCLGTGGLVGGSGYSWITSCNNDGEVSGYDGVGGIIGSTRVKGSENESLLYNQTVLRYCTNTGAVRGNRFVGGAVGEAQAGGFSVCNTGPVYGNEYVGGVCGGASLAVIHNSGNGATVDGTSYVGGIVGKCTWGSLAVCRNAGAVRSSNDRAGGIAGMAGNNTVIHYCSNFGDVDGGSGYAGGIVGDIGDPRTWNGWSIAECVVGSLECVMAFAGPALAVIEEGFELAEAVEITIKIVETSVEAALQTTDYVLLSYGIYELVSPEAEEALENSMRLSSEDINNRNTQKLQELSNGCSVELPYFTPTDVVKLYNGHVDKLMEWYGLEGNDEKFNEAINERREERAEALEKVARAHEIAHSVIAGVAVATSTVALIAGEVATGGLATAAVAAGSAAAIVGGVNAIVKSCTEFEKNAVIISQCINARKVTSDATSKAGNIAGRICDGSVVYDCLSTCKGSSQSFVGETGSHNSINHCISLVEYHTTEATSPIGDCMGLDPSASGSYVFYKSDVSQASKDAMAKPETFTKIGFIIGDDGKWILKSGYEFPLPNISEMQ